MNITLRKANALQNSITETIRSIKIETSIELNEFQNVEDELQRANNTLMTNDSRRQKLALAQYNIRGLIGAANSQSGLNICLTKGAFIDKRIGHLEELAKLSPITALDVIKGKLEKIRNRKEESRSIYGRDDTVSTGIVSLEQIEQAKAEINNLKKQKQQINDEVLELNIKIEIPLSEDVVATLTAEGLL
jgi:uncharacterized protein YdcH (DUF465 family)